ncbi:MAG TPA: hypothetical protein PLM57_14825 [Candidatus Latescibacteria bacterium]|nr:hypothetical protein [Candidatus Latescibacterota bacterium]
MGVIDEMIEIMEMSTEVIPEGKDEPESEEERLERALAVVKGDREASEELQETLAPFREEAYRFYRGRALGNERAGRSKVVSSDVMDAVEWVMPSLMRIYFSSDIVSCEPVGPEDQIVAERVSALLNYQFTRRGDGFVVAYKWFKDALIYGLGVAKISWEDRFRDVPFAVLEMSESDFNALSSENGVEITGFKRVEIPPDEVSVQRIVQQTVMGLPPDMPDDEKAEAVRMAVESMPRLATYFNVEGKRAILDYSGPVYEVIPPEDFLYDPEAEELRDARFVIHRVFRTPDYLRRMESEGVYFNVEEAIEKGNTQRDGDRSDREKGFRNAENDRTNPWTMTENIEDADKRRPLELYEWWGLFDPDGSGRLTPHVITVANDVVIRLERNPYDHGEPPFEVLRPVLDVHKFEGIGFADMVKEFQETKTSLRRQILDNISWQNNGMWEVQRGAGVEMESLVNPRPGGVVRTDMPGAVRPLTPPPLQQAGFMALEFEQTQLEQRTGITRYNQGLDSRSLNKTATGITALMGASQQRIELIARLFAETGVRSLFVKALSLNRQFMRDEFVVRLYGEPIVINKDDVSGQFDILVSVGISASKQEVVQQQMIQLIQMAPGLAQAQVMTPDNIYAIMVKLLEGWGFKDHSQLMTNPNVMGQMTQQMQQMQQQMQMMQMILQHPSIANVVPQIAQQVQQAAAQQAQAAPPPAQGEQPPAQGAVPGQGGGPI